MSRVNHHAHAHGIARVVIWIAGEPSLLEHIQQRREVPFPLRREPDVQGSGIAVIRRIGRSVFGIDTGRGVTVEGLQALEAGLDALPGKGIVTHEARPLVVVVTGAYGVDAKVDGTGATEAASTGVVDFAVVEVTLGGRLVAPVHVLVVKGEPALAVDAERFVVVHAAGLEEEDPGLLGRACQPGGDSAAGWTTCSMTTDSA